MEFEVIAQDMAESMELDLCTKHDIMLLSYKAYIIEVITFQCWITPIQRMIGND